MGRTRGAEATGAQARPSAVEAEWAAASRSGYVPGRKDMEAVFGPSLPRLRHRPWGAGPDGTVGSDRPRHRGAHVRRRRPRCVRHVPVHR